MIVMIQAPENKKIEIRPVKEDLLNEKLYGHQDLLRRIVEKVDLSYQDIVVLKQKFENPYPGYSEFD